MFDIGFAELIIVATVGLLVIGPERLPGAIRTGTAWLGRIKRGFNDIKREVEQEITQRRGNAGAEKHSTAATE